MGMSKGSAQVVDIYLSALLQDTGSQRGRCKDVAL